MDTSRLLDPPARERGCCLPVPEPLPAPAADEMAAVLQAMGSTTRLQMLHILKAAGQPVCVCDFTAAFDLSQPTISHHLAKLRAAGLVAVSREGGWSHWRLREDVGQAARAALALLP